MTLVNVAKKKIAGCLACEYCHKGGVHDVDNIEGGHQGNGACIQRMYCVNKPANVKKMALLMSSYSPNVYDGATAEFRDICRSTSGRLPKQELLAGGEHGRCLCQD